MLASVIYLGFCISCPWKYPLKKKGIATQVCITSFTWSSNCLGICISSASCVSVASNAVWLTWYPCVRSKFSYHHYLFVLCFQGLFFLGLILFLLGLCLLLITLIPFNRYARCTRSVSIGKCFGS